MYVWHRQLFVFNFGDFLKTSFPSLKKLANTKTSLDRLTPPKLRKPIKQKWKEHSPKHTYRVYSTVSEAKLQLKVKKKGPENLFGMERLSWYRCSVLPGPSLSRLHENNNKSKWWLHLQCRKAGKEAELNRVE